MSVWVVVEHRNGEVREVTAELAAAARQTGLGPVTGFVLGGPGETEGPAAALAGFDRVVRLEHEALRGGNAPAVVEALRRRAEAERPRLILGAHSAAGMDWAPALAARLGAPVATDVVALRAEGAGFSATRTVYGGKLQARVRLAEAPTAVVTVRPGTFAPAGGPGTGASAETLSEDLPADLGRTFVEWVQEAAGEVDITQADVLVSVGRGIGDPEDLDVARDLAEALGATLSCSRPVVDLGWLPKERQVGISGKTVKPKVYIALGISGAFQHVTAMKDSGLILAVNKDPKAPIFRVAHYGIVGDLFKVVPELTKAVREARG